MYGAGAPEASFAGLCFAFDLRMFTLLSRNSASLAAGCIGPALASAVETSIET
jgi:hypothetical protein